jgi:hypothetical protein
MKNYGEVRYQYNGSDNTYELNYPAVFAASGWPIIEFDPETFRVKRVYCEND